MKKIILITLYMYNLIAQAQNEYMIVPAGYSFESWTKPPAQIEVESFYKDDTLMIAISPLLRFDVTHYTYEIGEDSESFRMVLKSSKERVEIPWPDWAGDAIGVRRVSHWGEVGERKWDFVYSEIKFLAKPCSAMRAE